MHHLGRFHGVVPRSVVFRCTQFTEPPSFIRYPASPLTTYHDSLPGIDRNSGDNPEHIGLGEAASRGGVRRWGGTFDRTKRVHPRELPPP